jgi:molybdenum cofactor cytidylyltransferase
LPLNLYLLEIVKSRLMVELWAIILAGGESKRMKAPKMLLPFRGRTIIEKVIENVTSSGVDKTLVVLGAECEAILKVITDLPITHCYNDNYKEGMLTSVKCGFRSLPDDFEAVLVFQGDQPLIPPQTVNEVIEAWRKSGKGIAVPVFENKRGHPLLIDRKYKTEIEKLNDREGLRSLAIKFHRDVLEVNVKTPEILRDIDTQEDYLNEINQI